MLQRALINLKRLVSLTCGVVGCGLGNCYAVDYLHDIKPLLERKCYACHGAFRQQSELRVDTALGLLQGGESGPAIVPGDAEASLLIDYLTGAAGLKMPPENEGSPLTEAELAQVVAWIQSGAAAPDDEAPQTDPSGWWSYQPLSRPQIPSVQHLAWCRDPLDAFVLAAQERQGLQPIGEASPETWLRRVYLDLIGLPPSRDELHSFLGDPSPPAYERVVDDLLSRPEYGQRWGRHWMDIWRYSDWYGSRASDEIRYSQRHIWRWRDWIVNSLNADQGYQHMLRQMLAADELAGDHPDSVVATSYLGRNWYKFDRDVWLFETVERTGEALLGVTFRCCRCHDHKYDPISQEEYFRFRAFFEPHDVRSDPAADGLSDTFPRVYDKQLEAVTYRYARGDSRHPDKEHPLTPGVPAALGIPAPTIQPVSLPLPAWYPAMATDARQAMLAEAGDAVTAAQAKVAERQQIVEDVHQQLADAASTSQVGESAPPAVKTVWLTDDFSQPRDQTWQILSGQWHYDQGRLVEDAVTHFATLVTRQAHPTDFRVRLRYRTRAPGSYRSVGFSFDFQDTGNSHDVYTSTGDAKQSVQAFHRQGGRQHYPAQGIAAATLQVDDITELEAEVRGDQLTVDLNGQRKLNYTLPIARQRGKFALWVHQGAAEFLELTIAALPASLEALGQQARVAEHELDVARAEARAAQAELKSLAARITATLAQQQSPAGEQTQQLAVEAAAAERAAAVAKAEIELIQLQYQLAQASAASRLPAGEDQATQQLEQQLAQATTKRDELRAAPTAAEAEAYSPIGQQYPSTSSGRRLALANWITDPANPRTARVAANHLWGRHFGQPLVDTPANFGLNGSPPSHPALLDWLATELIANDWQMKPLHKRIVLSATYRLSSVAADSPTNRSLDPANRFLWHRNSTRMEAEVVRDATLFLAGRLDGTVGGPEIAETEGEAVPRRSLYFRNTPNEKMPFLEVFDVADPNACYRRKTSVVPHQSLALMNSGLVQDSARYLTRRLLTTAADVADEDTAFVIAAFETVLCRQPQQKELLRCLEFLQASQPPSPTVTSAAFPAGGTSRVEPSSDRHQRQREDFVHVLLLHNDFVTIR